MFRGKIPYEKLNFGLSIVGFIGSVGFYIGVLRKVYADKPAADQQRIEQLQNENEALRDQLKQQRPGL